MTISKFVLHAGATGIMFNGFKSLGKLQIYPEINARHGGFWQYLTIQGLFLAGLTMAISLVLDVLDSPRALKYIKRLLLVVALPLSVVISSIYWTLVLFFPSLILLKTKELSDDSPQSKAMIEMFFYIPLDMDLSLHAAPAVALALDFFLFERKYGRNATRVVAPLLASVYTVGYGLWVEYCSTKNDGVFPYPFLTNNALGVRLVIYVGAGFMQRTRPLPGHPEFSVIDHPGHREYRVESQHVDRNGATTTTKQAMGLAWRWAIVPVLFSLTPTSGLRWLVFVTVATLLLVIRKCTQVAEEAVIVMPPHGIQLETRRGVPSWPVFVSRRFIPLTTLRDVIINEGLRGWNVRYYLAAVREHPSNEVYLDVAFEGILPRLPILLEVYHGIHGMLLDAIDEEKEKS